MTLTTHALVGTMVASRFPDHPVLAFCVSFASHFVLDSIPHWDYKILSLRKNQENQLHNEFLFEEHFITDILRIGTDALLGLLASIGILYSIGFKDVLMYGIIGAAGGIFPDFLQFVYWRIGRNWLRWLQRFHVWIHPKKDLNDRPITGILFQLAIIILVFGIIK